MSKSEIDRPQAGLPDLRRLTQARVLLGRFGAGLPTRAAQSLLLDHARARQAVWSEVDWEALRQELADLPFDIIQVESLANDRATFVRRPDLGRRLSAGSAKRLAFPEQGVDVAVVVADGLSASAIAINAAPLVVAIYGRLISSGLSLAPLVFARQARVALADQIGESLRARVTITLIGERPGLSAADSLGIYMTHDAVSGTPDSRRNCISNVREGGLAIESAADAVVVLTMQMLRAGMSGVGLKDVVARLVEK